MVAICSDKTVKQFKKVNNYDDFNRYVNEQRLNTTFNGIQVAAFSWYKKILGLE